MHVRLNQITKRFGGTAVLRDISLEVRPHELFFLLGPSGCGKTTLLRLIAGFYQSDTGEVYFGERRMNGVPPHQRNTGMVFQNYALWPHLSVAANVAYGLEVRKVEATELKRRVRETLAIVQMEAYADRMPNQLSGGQQQRVALARALVIQPDVLLLDEPLSNLDARLRLELREEIRRIHNQTRITTIYVTHDQKESLSLADRMAVLHEGQVEQIGDPRTIYCQPASLFVADFIGESNWLEAEVVGWSGSTLRLSTAIGPCVARVVQAPAEKQVWMGFRPEAVRIGNAEENCWSSQIEHVNYLGEVEEYVLALGCGKKVKAFEQNPVCIREAGGRMDIHVRPENMIVLPRHGG